MHVPVRGTAQSRTSAIWPENTLQEGPYRDEHPPHALKLPPFICSSMKHLCLFFIFHGLILFSFYSFVFYIQHLLISPPHPPRLSLPSLMLYAPSDAAEEVGTVNRHEGTKPTAPWQRARAVGHHQRNIEKTTPTEGIRQQMDPVMEHVDSFKSYTTGYHINIGADR